MNKKPKLNTVKSAEDILREYFVGKIFIESEFCKNTDRELEYLSENNLPVPPFGHEIKNVLVITNDGDGMIRLVFDNNETHNFYGNDSISIRSK